MRLQKIGCIALFLCALTHAAEAQVVINEIMFAPSGSEFFDEYIELFNAGDRAVDLTGWRIGDDEETNALVGDAMVLAPGAYALVMDAGYNAHSTHYDPLPDTALNLTVDSATLGHSGLSNVHPERILLIAAAGDTVAAATYQPGNPLGISEEKIDAAQGDAPENWTDAKWPTPGAVNSISVKDRDLTLARNTASPVRVPWGGSTAVVLTVTNIGRERATSYEIAVNGNGVAVGDRLDAGDSTRVTIPIANPPAGETPFRARLAFAGDQDTTNNAATWIVIGGMARGQVVIAEVMAQGAEWIELYNRSPDPVSLSEWTISDVRTTGAFGAGAMIEGLGHVLVAEDAGRVAARYPDLSAPILSLTRWPRLNDGGDALVLRDATASVVDSVFYPAQETEASMERIDLAIAGESDNWLVSQSPIGATPGAANSVRFEDEVAGVSLIAEPNPFVDRVAIKYAVPFPRLHANLWVFDRTGRRVASLLEGVEGGSERVVQWDGRADNGHLLKPGIYILYLEAGTPDGKLFRVREPVVIARGLNDRR